MEWEFHRVSRNVKSSVKCIDSSRESGGGNIMSSGGLCINSMCRSNQPLHSNRATVKTQFSGPIIPPHTRPLPVHGAYQQAHSSVIQPPQKPRSIIAPQAFTRKSMRFKASWLEAFSWLQYDRSTNVMFCKYCRKWSDTIPEIRTSFAAGNGNFRLEIINHHDKCKAHNLCVTKETEQIVTKYENYY